MGIIFREFIIFLKHPVNLKSDVLSLKESVSVIVKSIGLYWLFTLLYAVIVAILYFWFDLKVTDFGTKTTNFFKIIIMAPVIEELIFRLPLKNFFKNIFISVGLLTYFFAKGYMPMSLAISFALVMAFLPYVSKNTREIEAKLNSFVYRHYGYLFYFLALSFGLLHITNVETFTSGMNLSAFVYVIHPLLTGLYFAFIRVKLRYGIIYSIIIHALTNLLPAILFN